MTGPPPKGLRLLGVPGGDGAAHADLPVPERARDVPDLQGAPRGDALPLLPHPAGRQRRHTHEEHTHGEAREVLLRAQVLGNV